MYMKVKTEADAWELARRLMPEISERKSAPSSMGAGYPVYRSTTPGSNASVCELHDRLELNYDDGHSENIWIEDRREKGAAVTVGTYRERSVFGEVMVRDVREIHYDMALGLVTKRLDDGDLGIEITLADGGIASFRTPNVAYVRFN